eukprot:1260831-Amphidinium_carterae.1
MAGNKNSVTVTLPDEIRRELIWWLLDDCSVLSDLGSRDCERIAMKLGDSLACVAVTYQRERESKIYKNKSLSAEP